MNSYTAIVPVRAGSRRLKNKNIAPFGGSNLLQHKINQLKKVKLINDIVVSSDSDYMLNLAKELGVKTHLRKKEYCDEETKTFGEVVEHICSEVSGDHVVWATCTAPLVFPEIYVDAIMNYERFVPLEYDSLISVEPFKRYIWSDIAPLNYELGLKHVPSQDLPNLYYVTDGILIAERVKMIKWKYFHGPKPYKYVLSKVNSVDIDDELDLVKASAWLSFLEKQNSNEYF